MKRNIVLFTAFAAAIGVSAQQLAQTDTIKTEDLEEVQVTATRATGKMPMAFANMDRKDIDDVNHGKDMASILEMMPSVTTSSDAGTGIGYTGIHIRGTDPTRINVTANGIPLNDSESSQLYWVNMGDLASSMQSVQIQRVVGTSTNGAGAFGATVNMLTENVGATPYGAVDSAAGSYGTHKETLRFSTGLLSNHWGLQGRLSNIASDGYIDRATSRLGSYFLQAAYYGQSTMVKFITFNGKEKTYMAWDYASKKDMERYGRTYNPSGGYTDDEGNTHYYSNQTDNYHQQHYQLILNQGITTAWKLNAALHYTRGDGYYEQYKQDQKLYKYLIPTSLRADLVRQKKMKNDFYGTIVSLNYDDHSRLTANIGGGWNKYDGDHFGHLLWMGTPYYWNDDDRKEYSTIASPLNADHEYYRNNAKKTDGNVYAKVNYEIVDGLRAFVDMQYRHVDYKMSGTSQEFDDDKQQRPLVMDRKYNFFNPKAGLLYQFLHNHTIYASYAIAHKEPTRNDFEDMLAETEEVTPEAERLNDLEVGYRYESPRFNAEANFYYMDYDNQFVLTGAQDSNGEMVARNIKDSYRLGLEMALAWQITDNLSWKANATFSQNRARNMNLTVINPDWSQSYINVGTTHLAFSPDIIAANTISYSWRGLKASLMTKYISEQYMTNSGFKSYQEDDGSQTSAMIDPIFTTDLDVSYTFRLRSIKNATVGLTIYNIFNNKYESNGSCSMNFRQGADGKVEAYNGGWAWSTYSAQAPTHLLAYLSLTF